MGFRPIAAQKKIVVLFEVIRKGKIEPVARSYGVSKPSVYTWLERSQEALKEALEPHKRGPKFKRSPEEKETEKLKEKVAKLENSLEEKDKKIKEFQEKLKPPKTKEKLPKCPYCGFEGVYKNGSYKRKPKKFFDRLKKIEEKEERVQGYLCPWRGKSFHIEKKGASSTPT